MKKIKICILFMGIIHFSFGQSFDPSQFNPGLWLDASDTLSITHSLGAVSAWNDISGNGNNATQSTAVNQPQYISTLEGVEFDGIDDVLIGNNLLYGSDTTLTIFVVAQPNTGSDVGSVIAKGQWTSGNDYRIELGENGYDICMQNAREWNSSGADWHIDHKNLVYTYYNIDNSVGYYLNGARQEIPHNNVSYSPNSSPFSIGGRFVYSDLFDGNIYEILLFQNELSPCEITRVEGYLFHKWGLQSYMIDNHAYKNYNFGICDEYEVSIDENCLPNTIISTVEGFYVDTAVVFTDWRIEDEGLFPGMFSLDVDGVLSVADNSDLDFEKISAVNIEVSAMVNTSRVYGGVRVNINDLPDGGTPKTNSALWGVNGEYWDPRGRLPDFSFVGYKSGEDSYNYVNTIVDVTDFGAVNSDSLSDVTAIYNAIASIDSGIIYFPPGLYIIDDYITISKDNIVLRGAGNDSISGTRFYMPKSSDELSGTYAYLLNFTGSLSGPKHYMTESSKMGDRSVTLDNVNGLEVGDFIDLGYSGTQPTDGELWDHILNNQNEDWPCSLAWSTGNGGLMMYHTIERIEGNIVTLREPIRLDLNMDWTPHLILRTDWYIKNCGIENIFISHKYIVEPPHLEEPGYNSISFSRAFNCWVDNVSIKDADNGIRFDVSAFSEIKNISYYGRGGHHGWTFAYSSHCLADNIHYLNYDPWIHSFTLTHKASGNVVSNVDGISDVFISTDFHRNTPWETLITNVDNDWNYNSSGVWCAGPNAGKRTVYWNMGGDGFTQFPSWDEFQTTLVGEMHIAEKFHPQKGWHEKVENISPSNLHVAQLNRRLTLPVDPAFCLGEKTGLRENYWERDPSRWIIKDGTYRLYFSEFPSLTGNRMGEYSVLDSIFTTDMTISADIKSLENININTQADAALIVNYQDDNNYYYAHLSNNQNESGIYKVINGIRTLLKQIDIEISNLEMNYALQNINGILKLYENGAVLDSIPNNELFGGKVGFGSFDDAASFDNISLKLKCIDVVIIKNKIFDKNRKYEAGSEIILQNVQVESPFELFLNAPIISIYDGSSTEILSGSKLTINSTGCYFD